MANSLLCCMTEVDTPWNDDLVLSSLKSTLPSTEVIDLGLLSHHIEIDNSEDIIRERRDDDTSRMRLLNKLN